MKFFCPRCHMPVATDGGISHVICPSCGLEIDLEMADTNVGRPQLQLVVDHSGSQIGPYQLHTCLGNGGMGSVYRATDSRNGREVALKVLYPQLAAMPHLLERFRREAEALKQLNDEHIVAFVEAGETAGVHYIVMEYAAGEDLGRILARKPLDIMTALSYARGIALALAAAHKQGVVHRDLKPANVIVKPDGSVQVLDFGIAQVGACDQTLTHTDAMLGTFNYMSPEQRSSAKDADHRSDLYALGVLLYQMTTQTLPIGTLERPRRLNRAISGKLERLLLNLLKNNPSERPQSASAVADAFQCLQRASSAGRIVWVAGVLFVVALLAVGIISLRTYWDEPKSKQRPVVRQPKVARPAAESTPKSPTTQPANTAPNPAPVKQRDTQTVVTKENPPTVTKETAPVEKRLTLQTKQPRLPVDKRRQPNKLQTVRRTKQRRASKEGWLKKRKQMLQAKSKRPRSKLPIGNNSKTITLQQQIQSQQAPQQAPANIPKAITK